MMRALIFDGQSVQLDRNHTTPRASAGEAVVRLSKAIISFMDLGVVQGWINHRGVIGHQFVGTVETVHGEAGHLVGKRVVGSPILFCGKCDMCLSGLSRHCRNRKVLGMECCAGCMAEQFVIPSHNLIELPAKLDDDQAAFAVEVASAMHAASQVTIQGKPYITVIGDNSLALLTLQMMAKLNASVRLIASQEASFAICEKWGIKHRGWDEAGRRADQDVVVECTGTPKGFDLALLMVRPRGKVLLKALLAGNPTTSTAPCNLNAVVLNEIDLLGSFIGSVAEAVTAIDRRQVDVMSLIGRRMRLEDGPAILKAAQQASPAAVVVEP